MEEIKYQQAAYDLEINKEEILDTRKVSFVIAAEATGREHRNKFLYNWDNWSLSAFNANPIVGYQHNVYGDNMCVPSNPDDVVAKAVAKMGEYKGKRAILAEAEFEPANVNPTAEKVLQKIAFGTLRATSTGVNPMGKLEMIHDKNAKGEIVDSFLSFAGQELLEFSIVNIPADPNALRRSMKSHAIAALNFLQRSLPDLSLSDMKGMKVQELLDLFEGKGGKETEKVEAEIVGPDPNLNRYLERLSKIQNKRK